MLTDHASLQRLRALIIGVGSIACVSSEPVLSVFDQGVLTIDCATNWDSGVYDRISIHSFDGSLIAGKIGRACRPLHLTKGEHTIGFVIQRRESGGGITVEWAVACYSRLSVRSGEIYTVNLEFRGEISPPGISLRPDYYAWLESATAGEKIGVTFCHNPAAGNRWASCWVEEGFPQPLSMRPPPYPETEFLTGTSGTVEFSASVGRDGFIRRVHSLVGNPEGFGGRHPVDSILASSILDSWIFHPADVAPLESQEFRGGCEFRHPADSSDLGSEAGTDLSESKEMEPIPVPQADCSDPDPEIIVPVSTVNPRYPSGALRKRISGFVTLEFTITAQGETADIVVVASVPPGVFDDAAIRALSQWRYCALGKERRGVRTRLSFDPQ